MNWQPDMHGEAVFRGMPCAWPAVGDVFGEEIADIPPPAPEALHRRLGIVPISRRPPHDSDEEN